MTATTTHRQPVARHRGDQPARRFSWRFWAAFVAIAAALVFGGFLIHEATASGAPAADVSAPAPLLVRFATVTAVRSGDTVVVDGTQDVRVVGLRAPAPGECGYGQVVDHARVMLAGRRVTLVPDPAAPGAGEHVVMADQESYADEALLAGMGRVAPGSSTYRDVELREQQQAQDAGRGLWGRGQCWGGER